MVDTKKYHVIDQETGHLDRRIFADPEIYQEELEKIFGRAWLMIGHESLIPKPNDFFLTYMGEDPVILTRDATGQLHAFLNMCRHRGNRIVRAEILAGNLGTIILYFLMKIMLAIAVGIIAVISTCLTCCLAAIPYLGTVILLPLYVFTRCYPVCFLAQLGPNWQFFPPDPPEPVVSVVE